MPNTLEDLVTIAELLAARIAEGADESEILDLVNATRKGRDVVITTPPVAQTAEEFSHLSQLQARMEKADQVLTDWLLPKENCQMTAEKISAALIPLPWDLGRDVMILPFDTAPEIVAAMKDHGQARILFIRDEPMMALRIRVQIEKFDSYVLHSRAYRFPESTVPEAIFLQGVKHAQDGFSALKMTFNTLYKSGAMMLTNAIGNYKYVPADPRLPRVKPNRTALIVVGAGPSLDKNVDVLKRAAGKVIVAACSHALPALGKAGVVPDIVLAGDGQDLTLSHFEGFDTSPCVLITGISAPPKTCKLPWKKIHFYSANPKVDTWLGLTEIATAGGTSSVGPTLAHLLGCKALAYVGHDLAFKGDRRYASAVEEYWTPDPVKEVRGWYGPVWTSEQMDYMRMWFEDAARQIKLEALPLALYNCSEGGAYIDGWNHISLETFLLGDFVSPEPILSALQTGDFKFDAPSPHKKLSLVEAQHALSLLKLAWRGSAPSRLKTIRERMRVSPFAPYFPKMEGEKDDMWCKRVIDVCKPLLDVA